MAISVFRLELKVDEADGAVAFSLEGRLSEMGQALMVDENFKALIDGLTLAASQAMEQHVGDKDSERFYSGPGAESSGMKQFIAETGAKAKPDVELTDEDSSVS